ncbi:MAG: hypothetical protein FWG81_05375 [Betaproteobacteria bacterium]|nr:hypothetical protein [Betaproteobacteria bacterium]
MKNFSDYSVSIGIGEAFWHGHAFLILTTPGGVERIGFYPNVEMGMPDRIRVDMNDGKKEYGKSPEIPISEAQYNRIIEISQKYEGSQYSEIGFPSNNCATAAYGTLQNAGIPIPFRLSPFFPHAIPIYPLPYNPEFPETEPWWNDYSEWVNDFHEWLSENRYLDTYFWFFDHLLSGDFYNQIANEVNDLYQKARHLLVVDPLVLDLDGDGQISTVGMNGYKTVLFDHTGDGVKTGTGWVLPNDGFLAIDKNGNGVIDNGTELFGAAYVKQDGELALNGLDALSDLDSNEDGVFDANDAAFNQVQVWRDLNQDGISQANELFSLAALGITSIDLSGTAVRENLGDGNVMTATTTYTRADGTEGLVANLDLSDNPFYREIEEKIPLSPETALLPNIHGSGGLYDLREAAEFSPHSANPLATYLPTCYCERSKAIQRFITGLLCSAHNDDVHSLTGIALIEAENEAWFQEAA